MGFTPSSSNPSGAPSSSTRCPGLMPSFCGSGVPEYPAEDMARSLRVWYSTHALMSAVVTEEPVAAPPAAVEEAPVRAIAGSTLAAVAAVLAWYLIQLAAFVGEAPDLDAMISLRESLVAHRDGLHGLIADRVGTGVHPPLLDLLSSSAFSLFGEDPRSQQLIGIALFALLAGAVERLLVPFLPTGQRVAAAFAVVICPSLAITLFLVSREALVLVILAAALAYTLVGPGVKRPVALGLILALLPLAKETAPVLLLPFAVYAALAGGDSGWKAKLRRGALVLAPAVAAIVAWRIVLAIAGGNNWHTWIVSKHADDGPYVVALRAIFGLEGSIYWRQNLVNGFIVNYLWVPTLLAVVAIVLALRKPAARRIRRAIALLAGLGVIYAWTTLTFPTFTEPRYATPLALVTLLIALIGLPLWSARWRPVMIGVLIVAFAAGSWSPTDPVSRKFYGTTSVGGEQIYNTAELQRGPDRMVINYAILRASHRLNARLRRIFASGATLVTGDCNTMKFGEKLFSVGFQASAFDRGIPGARPLKCVPVDQLPPGAANGPDKIALVRTPEEDAQNQPLPVHGRSVVVIH
jgi:hypothetical protein